MIPVLPPRRIKQMWRKFGLTEAAFLKLWRRQRGRCPLCGRAFRQVRQAHVDHDHRTGKVRGLLDTYCNHRFLGPLERGGIVRVRNAVRYLHWTV